MILRIVQIRKAKGLTQDELATRCETTQQQIAKIETGVADTKISTLGKVATALGCEVKDLFYSRNEFVQDVNEVIQTHQLNLEKIRILELNNICWLQKRIPSFHPFWESIKIKDNKVVID